MKPKIKILGMKDMTDLEIAEVKSLADKYYPKIARVMKDDDFQLIIHVKKADTTGNRSRYQIKAKADSVDHGLFGTKLKIQDWDLARSLHKVFKNLKGEVQHKLRSEGKARKFLFWRR